LYKSINLAIKVVALAATCMEYMPLICATPLLHLFAYGTFMVPFIWYNMYFASEGSMDPVKLTYTHAGDSGLGMTDIDGSYLVGYSYSNVHQWTGGKIWFLFFVLLWTMNFIAGIGSLVIAYATATWYFTPVPERSKITSCTVLDSYGVILRYHTGTAALGALLIATLQFLRWMLTYIEHNIVQGKGNGADNTVNCLRKSVICLLTCCLYCLEKVIKFISKQAYIQTAIHGEPYIKGAINAFYTIARNIFSVGGVQVISGMAIVIGKIFVSAICGVSAFYIFASGWLKFQNQMKDIIAPTFLVLLIAYITASLIFEVFHMIVDTMIMCYITDAEQNDGIPQFADQTLSEFLADHGTLNMDHIPVNQTGMEMKDLKVEMAKPAPIQVGAVV
jgi:Plasma-membrane choline transporter